MSPFVTLAARDAAVIFNNIPFSRALLLVRRQLLVPAYLYLALPTRVTRMNLLNDASSSALSEMDSLVHYAGNYRKPMKAAGQVQFAALSDWLYSIIYTRNPRLLFGSIINPLN